MLSNYSELTALLAAEAPVADGPGLYLAWPPLWSPHHHWPLLLPVTLPWSGESSPGVRQLGGKISEI